MSEGLLDTVEAVERRTRATHTVRRIMHALLVVSRAQYAQANVQTQASVQYYELLDDVLNRLAGAPRESSPKDTLLVVLGPERALCGNLVSTLVEASAGGTELALVGTYLAQRPELSERAVFTTPGVGAPIETETKAAEVGRLVVEHARGRAIELLFPVSTAGAPHRELLLAERRLEPELSLESYSPPAVLLPAVIAQLLTGRITHALAQTLQAELASRIIVAERARQRCDEELAALEDTRRVLQKEYVTSELAEVIAGRQHARQRI